MSTAEHPELAQEQEYIDRAFACLEEMREDAGGLIDAAGDTKARNALYRMGENVAASLDDAENAICAGRLDFDTRDTLYVGRRAIRERGGEYLVISWAAPAAKPFYSAGRSDPQGLDRRRRFQLNGRVLEGISDELFTNRFEQATLPVFVDVLLEELRRARGSQMRDIVATIEADQYRLITQPPEVPIVIQGAPGTGKTAVVLHRAAWLLSSSSQALTQRGVLFIGPNRTFMRYIERVLPGISDEAVDQAPISMLVAGARARGHEELAVMRLKGDIRMAAVIQAAIDRRIRPSSGSFRLTLDGHQFELTSSRMREVCDGVIARRLSYAEGRNQFRNAILRALYDSYRVVAESKPRAEVQAPQDFERAFRSGAALQRVLDRSWPATSSRELLRDLLQGPRILADAAQDVLSPEEQSLLLRPPVDRIDDVRWTESDLALLDEANAILQGVPERWGHVIVDEAQDLTPMQLRMVSRRALRGAMTLAGDIAQATGPCSYETWTDITAHLVGPRDVRVEELTNGYRVAGEVMAYAARLLPEIAPGATAPVAYRPGAGEPSVTGVSADHVLSKLVEIVTAIGGGSGTVAVIVPDSEMRRVSAALDAAGIEFGEAVNGLSQPIEVLTPRHAKGLEFDDVVVFEPRTIADDGPNGLRELYVGLTRATQQLYVVHSRGLPALLGPEPAVPTSESAAAGPVDEDEGPTLADCGRLELTEALALVRVFAQGSTRPLSQRMIAGGLVLADGGTHDETIAALLLPGVDEQPPGLIGGAPIQIIAECVGWGAGDTPLDTPTARVMRVLAADAVAFYRRHGLASDEDSAYDRIDGRRLLEAARDAGISLGLTRDLDDHLRHRH